MNWKGRNIKVVEFSALHPKPLQVAVAIAEDIQSGTLREGDCMPTLKELAELYGISVATIGTAYKLLKNKDIIDKDIARRYRVYSTRKAGVFKEKHRLI